MKKKKGIDIDIVYTRELGNFIRNLNTNIRKNLRTVNNQVRVVQKYFLKYEEPYSEISQNFKALLIKVKLPYTKKRDIILRILGDKVEIEGVSNHKNVRKGFFRKVDLPSNVKVDRAKAVFKNETLKIKIPLAKMA